ncbi:phosphatidylserine synthase [Eremomyces bilateralis CBS 781.70]|uniref:CDP-diacylglycerol--serine O-phosphatidyltransferase n=1 Tax=Eremomyces bilateralis CBS 781.70 TaxID=1392243 RepID=A0A6G1GID0_9PEZI|nr:phosphatidylserine synthase [Eremomyces bilateralis CBS 781.70]KAF1817620.1 phosphatidylserine synthase [Eremomyces bilateralis CBS 781.70]
MSIFSSLRYCLSESAGTTTPASATDLWLAVSLPALGLFFDFLDGRVARWRKKSSLMGQELDSLADLISFGVAPAMLAFTIGMRSCVDQLLLTVYILCGLTRLARFNVTATALPKDASGKSKYFEGTPIPTSLMEVSIMAFWVSKGWIMEKLPGGAFGEGQWWEFHVLAGVFVIHGCLMCSKTLHVPKP